MRINGKAAFPGAVFAFRADHCFQANLSTSRRKLALHTTAAGFSAAFIDRSGRNAAETATARGRTSLPARTAWRLKQGHLRGKRTLRDRHGLFVKARSVSVCQVAICGPPAAISGRRITATIGASIRSLPIATASAPVGSWWIFHEDCRPNAAGMSVPEHYARRGLFIP